MSPWLSFFVAILALLISGTTLWRTFFHRGKLLMTQPTTVFFGPDGPLFDGRNKIYLRTLLYCTAKRGQVVESLYLTVHRHELKQNFSVWVYGDEGPLRRGSGVFVPQDGVTFDHHFLQPDDGSNFVFLAGAYRIVLFAKLVRASAPVELATLDFTISDLHAAELQKPNTGLYFDWGPNQQAYYARPQTKVAGDEGIKAFAKFLRENG